MKDHNPFDLEGQARSKAQAERREQLARHNEVEDFKKLMAEAWGRRFVWRQLDVAGVYRSSFTGNSETFFREGMRNAGLRILALIHEHCPEMYALMLAEAKASANEEYAK